MNKIEKWRTRVSQRDINENIDQGVIDTFGHEWAAFDYAETETAEALDAQFAAYCAPLDLGEFNPVTSVAGDFGAGTGWWSSKFEPFWTFTVKKKNTSSF